MQKSPNDPLSRHGRLRETCALADYMAGVTMSFFDLSTPRNRLLAQLPAKSWEKLRPHLHPVEMELRQTLYEPEEPISAVYFPQDGWVSMVAPLEDGDGAEVGLIGYEGMVGLPALLGGESDDLEALVQGSGAAFKIGVPDFQQAVEADPLLRSILLRYVQAHHAQVTRTAACNGRHQTEQRLARWLLMAHDRAQKDSFTMTHEFLSLMLGVRRAGVTVAAGALQRAHIINYDRGQVSVIDRDGLENASCECYGAARRSYERLCGPPGPRQIYRQ
jgi:CRP-like cAMP-binding protein